MINAIGNISDLPSPDRVKRHSQGLALMDAIMMPEWEYRYFSFNCNWDGHHKEMLASMRDGQGSEYFLHFSEQGVAGKVLSAGHQLTDSKAFLRNVPAIFSGFANEPAFDLQSATFFFWRDASANQWLSSPSDLKSYPLLGFLVDGALAYQKWAENYYEKKINADVLEEVFASLKITAGQLRILNPDITIDELDGDINEICC